MDTYQAPPASGERTKVKVRGKGEISPDCRMSPLQEESGEHAGRVGRPGQRIGKQGEGYGYVGKGMERVWTPQQLCAAAVPISEVAVCYSSLHRRRDLSPLQHVPLCPFKNTFCLVGSISESSLYKVLKLFLLLLWDCLG